MTKAELILAIAKQHDLSTPKAGEILDFTLNTIAEALERGESVRLRGFGNFVVKERSARKGRSLVTGESIDIPARRVPVFKHGAGLGRRVGDAKPTAGATRDATVLLDVSQQLDARGAFAVELQDVELQSANKVCKKSGNPLRVKRETLFAHLMDIRDCTTFLWRRLNSLKDGEKVVTCMVREITYNCVTENLQVLSDAGMFKFETEAARSKGDSAILNLRLHDISPELRNLVQQAVAAA